MKQIVYDGKKEREKMYKQKNEAKYNSQKSRLTNKQPNKWCYAI